MKDSQEELLVQEKALNKINLNYPVYTKDNVKLLHYQQTMLKTKNEMFEYSCFEWFAFDWNEDCHAHSWSNPNQANIYD